MASSDALRYQLIRRKDGQWQAALLLPEGDGSFASVAKGLTKAEATVKAARAMQQSQPKAPPNKTEAVKNLARAAATPAIREALKAGGLAAATAAAAAIPGGGAVVQALKLAAKYGPAKRFLSKLL
jgi:hypothetical protein